MERDLVGPPAYFQALGDEVSLAWTAAGRQQSELPDVAEQSLARVEVPDGLDALKILNWAAGATGLPRQSSAQDMFGQPPLVLHQEEDFFIQALTWMDGTTAIHQHGFAGAFMVLQGASLHVTHSFAPVERIADDRIIMGDLRMLHPEVLRPLDVRRIDPGYEFIHALFHLERPTVTIVVRNASCGLSYPQYTYRSPGLGWDGLWKDRTWSKRVQCVDAVIRLDPDLGIRTVEDLVSHASPWEAFCMIDHWCALYGWTDVTADLVDRLVKRVGSLAEVLAPALEREACVRRILLRRGMLHAPHQRAFLALVAILPDAAAMNDVLRQLFPDRTPVSLLLDWVKELSSPALRGVSGLSLTPDRLEALQAVAVEGHEQEMLADINAAWGMPLGLPSFLA